MKKNMEPDNDPMGLAARAFYDTGDNTPISIYSSATVSEIMTPKILFRTWSTMPLIEKKALKNCVGSVLNIGAGAGCHSLYLQKRGYRVDSVEYSFLLCEVMRKQGIEFIIQADFFSYDFNSSKYDTLLLLMNGIGLVSDTEGLRFFLKKAYGLLKIGGKIICDSSDIRKQYPLERAVNEQNMGIVEYQLSYKKSQGKPFYWFFIDFYTLRLELEQAGFSCRKLTGRSKKHFLIEAKKIN